MENTALVNLSHSGMLWFNQEALELLEIDKKGSKILIGYFESELKSKKIKKTIYFINIEDSLFSNKEIIEFIKSEVNINEEHLKEVNLMTSEDGEINGFIKSTEKMYSIFSELAKESNSGVLEFKLIPCFKLDPTMKAVKENYSLSDNIVKLVHVSSNQNSIGEERTKAEDFSVKKMSVEELSKSPNIIPGDNDRHNTSGGNEFLNAIPSNDDDIFEEVQ